MVSPSPKAFTSGHLLKISKHIRRGKLLFIEKIRSRLCLKFSKASGVPNDKALIKASATSLTNGNALSLSLGVFNLGYVERNTINTSSIVVE